MAVIDLKQGDLEQVLADFNLSQKDRAKIMRDFPCHDEYYYLTESKKIVKGFRQEFRKDPYMDLPPILKFRLVNYPEGTDLEELEEIFSMDTVPIITRVSRNITLPRFTHMPNKYGAKTVLIPVKVPIPPASWITNVLSFVLWNLLICLPLNQCSKKNTH